MDRITYLASSFFIFVHKLKLSGKVTHIYALKNLDRDIGEVDLKK